MFVINVPNLNLDTIYRSGQGYNWKKGIGSTYVIPNGEHVLKASQRGTRLQLDCSEREFFSVWYDYFGVGLDYGEINERISRAGGFLARCVKAFPGFRLLRQDPFEALIVAILRSMVEDEYEVAEMHKLVVQACGEVHRNAMGDAGRVLWLQFPTPEQIIEYQTKLSDVLPEAAPIIVEVARDLRDGWYSLDEPPWDDLSYYPYLNEEILSSWAIHGLGSVRTAHIDKIIASTIRRYANVDPEDFVDWYFGDIGDVAAIALAYISAYGKKGSYIWD